MSPLNSAERILLTGAGFTHDFGGFLAKEIWALLFNHRLMDKYPKLKAKLRNEFNYEQLYNEIIDGKYEFEEKQAIKIVIRDAYLRLDENIRQTFHTNAINLMAERFAGELGGSGFFFTLNQDLFIERDFGSSKTNLSCPGINNRIRGIRDHPFSEEYYERLPTSLEKMVEPLSATRLHYIKLHGSLNWKRSDGTDALVIGTYKVHQIEQEPLLNWYFNLFREELSKSGRKLLIIGYGFGDEHINTVIIDSISNHGLRVFVVSPSSPREFKANLYLQRAGPIWDHLTGYYPYKLINILEDENNWKGLHKDFF